MKKFFTLCLLICIVIVSRSQAVLNEIYPQPGNGYHEFFELYNPGTTPGSENLDNYTIVTYYEEAVGKSGFYVLDMPNQTLNSQGYYVCASQSPFDIQSQTGITANSSWNSLPSGGVLTKWEKSGSSYTSVTVPANLNDLFVKISGAGGVFHVFVFKNGIIVNGFIGGTNSNVIPAYIKSMPDLFVDMSGSSPDFTINFNTIADNSVDYISSSVGTNNGYFRSADGKCGVWLKSDSPGQHTPGQTNGSAANAQGQLSVAAVISQYATDPAKSLLIYNITAGPAAAFPVTVEVYSDLGVIGELDLNDILVDSQVINDASAGSQNIILPTNDDPVIIVIRSASGCHDKIIPVDVYLSSLPIHLVNFQGNINKANKATLQWTIANNETVDQFEVQRSYDGNEFKTIGIVFASEKKDIEDYMFYETISSFDKIMYRLKMIGKANEVGYSKILVFQTKLTTINNNIKIIGNPVNDKLTFSYTAFVARSIDIKIYDMSGRVMMNSKLNSLEGNNIFSFTLSPALKPNLYLVEVSNGIDIQTTKFVKQ
jgi:hypothetical protein